MESKENMLDDQGTTQIEAQGILENLLSQGFDNEIDLLAEALGRPAAEIEAIIDGDETMDEDLLMKARRLAQERNIDLDN